MRFILMILLLVSFNSYSNEKREEFDPVEESNCLNEMIKMGCAKGRDVNPDCVDNKVNKLSKNCSVIHRKKRFEHHSH
jgi:hypothetical protein